MKLPEKITVDFDPNTLDMLFRRLKDTRWPDIIGEDRWVYGEPRSWLQEMVDFRVTEWDWEKISDQITSLEKKAKPIIEWHDKESGKVYTPSDCTADDQCNGGNHLNCRDKGGRCVNNKCKCSKEKIIEFLNSLKLQEINSLYNDKTKILIFNLQ